MKGQTQAHTATPYLDPATPGSLLANLGGGLVALLVIAACFVWAVRRFKGVNRRLHSASGLSVISSHSLGQRERLIVVDMQDKRLLLGVTGQQINCVATFDRPEQEEKNAPFSGGTDFQATLKKLLTKREAGPAE